ncbi:MAG: PAS domain-containing protein [Betaproteobacteria bacterium]|nr:PAS domain-containing protein [Betaproteobacteria bacterium]
MVDAGISHIAREAAEIVPHMVWSTRAGGHLDYFNRRAIASSGRTLEELVGWGWLEIVHPEDRERCMQAWIACLGSGDDYQIEYRLMRGSDRSWRWHVAAALRCATTGAHRALVRHLHGHRPPAGRGASRGPARATCTRDAREREALPQPGRAVRRCDLRARRQGARLCQPGQPGPAGLAERGRAGRPPVHRFRAARVP